MKSLNRIVKLSSALAVLASATSALATLNLEASRGSKSVEIPVQGSRSELCVIPKHFGQGAYSKKDAKREEALCALNTSTNAAACAKLNSTNPGLDIYTVPEGSTSEKVRAANCSIKDEKGKSLAKKVAKYKLSTSCSYSPSILGYYHVSRMLGDIANVPVSVLRTYDLKNHLSIGQKALAKTKPEDLIHKTWAGLVSQLTAGTGASRKDLLFTNHFDQSYGALVFNPTDESFYKEFFNGGANNEARTINLRDKNPIIALLASPSSKVGTDFTADNVQKMVQLKDASDMIVLDTIMNQQDRMGNIHALTTYYYLDTQEKDADGSPMLKSSKSLKPEEVKSLKAVAVKEMLLKDNDCGVAKDNIDKKVGLIARVGHMAPSTYQSLLTLASQIDSSELKSFFSQEVGFTSDDFASFKQNVKDVSTRLHTACTSGKLKLDLDLRAHFAGRASEASCDL